MRSHLKQLLEQNALEQAGRMLATDRRIISPLLRIAYHKDTLVGRRAIIAVGMAARELVKTDYEFLRETCRKLLWSLSDESGSIGWSAPELLGEIVSADPKRFSDLVPLIASVYDIEETHFRPGVLYALSRIAEKDPSAVLAQLPVILRALEDGDAEATVYALDIAGRLWHTMKGSSSRADSDRINMLSAVERLRTNMDEAWIYRNDKFESVQVGEHAILLINILNNK